MVELHGNLTTARCEACRKVAPLPTAADFTPPPTCQSCGSRMRPNIVWFGEFLPEDALHAAKRAFQAAEVALIIGTSGAVYPAAGLAHETRYAGGTVIEINPDETELSDMMNHSVRDVASRGLAALLEE